MKFRIPLETEWAVTEPVLARIVELQQADEVALERLIAQIKAAGMAGDGAPGMSFELTPQGVGVFRLSGIVAREESVLGWLFGEILTPKLDAQLRQAGNDPMVREIAMVVDSPGGDVMGTEELANTVAEIASKKRITGYVDGLCASAAYWFLSQATEIHAGPSALVGSIGVYSTVRDRSRAFENEGVRVHVLRSGAEKGGDIPGAPVPQAYLASVQRRVDTSAAQFRDTVAQGRHLRVPQIAAIKGGDLYPAAEARSLGLIDSVSTFANVMTRLTKNTNPSPYAASDHQEEQEMPNIRQRLGLAATATEDDIEHAIKVLEDKANAKPEPKTAAGSVDLKALAAELAPMLASAVPDIGKVIDEQVAKRLEAAERERKVTAMVAKAIEQDGVVPVGARAEALAVATKAPEEFAALAAKLPSVTPLKRRYTPSGPADAASATPGSFAGADLTDPEVDARLNAAAETYAKAKNIKVTDAVRELTRAQA